MKLIDYLKAERGRARSLASALEVSVPFVWQMAESKRPVPVGRAVQIESITEGAVHRRDMRPDDAHLLWPDLPSPAGGDGIGQAV